MVAIASDETLDRHGDVLKIQDWDLKNYKKNPVLQFAHDYSTPPVGKAANIRVEKNKLLFEPIFHEITQAGRETKKLFEEGFMSAFSVGFIDHESDKGSKLELLEISAVPVPANPAALVLQRSIKEFTEEDKKQINEWVAKEAQETVGDQLDEQKKREQKWNNLRQVDSIMSAFYQVYMESEMEVEKFGDLLTEAAGILVQLAESGNVVAGKSVKDFSGSIFKDFENVEVEEKQGRVLSKKNRSTLVAAREALDQVITADDAQEESEKSIEPKVIKMGEDIDNSNSKGRTPNDEVKSLLEAMKNQVGFIARNIKKSK